jgi:hypothetical protein
MGNVIVVRTPAMEGLVRDLGRKIIKKVLAAIDQTVERRLSVSAASACLHVRASAQWLDFGSNATILLQSVTTSEPLLSATRVNPPGNTKISFP